MRALFLCLFAGCAAAPTPQASSAKGAPKLYVILWFDTEDYLLPASDDAALWVSSWLTSENIRATFKVVGEKARTLERRGRTDVIAALKKHEIGYHSNFHSVHPTPAQYLSALGWDEGVAEFERREGPGVEDLKRIFGVSPTCYGQPGSSWGPQSFGAMKKWGMQAYLDVGNHVNLEERPNYYCGLLNLYRLAGKTRISLTGPQDVETGKKKFLEIREKLLAEGGGVVSIFYHPCEFVHQMFWDGVNFMNGANPPREQWKAPLQKTEEETRIAKQTFMDYMRFIKSFPEAQWTTASEAARLYRDKARGRAFSRAEIKEIAGAIGPNVGFQKRDDIALAASEIFWLLNEFVAGRDPAEIKLVDTSYGPSEPAPNFSVPAKTDWSQFSRTAADVSEYMRRQGRIPSTVWLGSLGVPPEVYLRALGAVAAERLEGKTPQEIEIKPAWLEPAKYVPEDRPDLWGWLFPEGFHAPRMMELAKRQAWTLKPAILDDSK